MLSWRKAAFKFAQGWRMLTMTGEKRMLEDLRLEPLLHPSVTWSLSMDGEVIELRVLRPPGDSLNAHLQWVVGRPGGAGWSPGPDAILTDSRRFLLVVEAKREDTSSHSTTRRDALWKALGYSILFDRRRNAPEPMLWVGTNRQGIPLQQILGLPPVEFRSMILVPGVVGLAPVRGNGLRLAHHVADFIESGRLPEPPRERRWQRDISDVEWTDGHARLKRWAVAERVAEGAKTVRLTALGSRDGKTHEVVLE